MLIFLYGEDTYRSYQKMKELEDKFVREVDPSRINLCRVDNKMEIDQLRQALSSPPFLARKRLVLIPELDILSIEIKEELLKFFDKKNADEIIIIVRCLDADEEAKKSKEFLAKLKKNKYVEEFKLLKGKGLEKVVAEMVVAEGGKIDVSGLSALVAMTQGDLWQIKNELMKLVAYTNGRQISKDDVWALVSGSFDENIFHLLDAVGNNNKEEAMMLFDGQIQAGVAPILLLYRLIGYVRQLLAVRLLLDEGKRMADISRELNLHPYVGEKISRQIKNWGLTKLKETYKKLLAIEFKSKTGKGDFLTLISAFICE